MNNANTSAMESKKATHPNQHVTVLDKRVPPSTSGKGSMKLQEVYPQSAAAGIELGMQSIDSIGGRMYASDGSISRIEPTPDVK